MVFSQSFCLHNSLQIFIQVTGKYIPWEINICIVGEVNWIWVRKFKGEKSFFYVTFAIYYGCTVHTYLGYIYNLNITFWSKVKHEIQQR